MTVQLVSKTDEEFTIEVKIPVKRSMLESEGEILKCVNQVGALATEAALKQCDADGTPIKLGNVKYTSRCINGKTYQTPFGAVHIERHVYQTSKGGKVYVPLDSGGRIIQGASLGLLKYGHLTILIYRL